MRLIPFKSGDEHDALGEARFDHSFGHGKRKEIKKRYNKRVRRFFKKEDLENFNEK